MGIEKGRDQEELIIDSLSIRSQIYMMICGVTLLAGTFSIQNIQKANEAIDQKLATMQKLTKREIDENLEDTNLEDQKEKPSLISFIALAKVQHK